MMFVCISIFVYAIIYYAFFGYLAFVVDGKGLGNAASTGFATMVMTAVSMIAGVIFAQFVTKLGKVALPAMLIFNVIGFYLLSAAATFQMIIVSSVFIGLGFGLLMPYGTSKVTSAAPPAAAVFANGLYMTFVNIGTAVSPTILVALGKGFNNPDGQFIFFCCAVVLAAAAIISIIYAMAAKTKTKVSSAE